MGHADAYHGLTRSTRSYLQVISYKPLIRGHSPHTMGKPVDMVHVDRILVTSCGSMGWFIVYS